MKYLDNNKQYSTLFYLLILRIKPSFYFWDFLSLAEYNTFPSFFVYVLLFKIPKAKFHDKKRLSQTFKFISSFIYHLVVVCFSLRIPSVPH